MLEKLFEKISAELLTDDVKLELSTIFESAINSAIADKEQKLEEANKTEIAEFKAELVEKVDEYLTYFVDEYMKENKVGIAESVKVETAERVLGIFSGVVNDFHVSLDEKVVEESSKIGSLETTLNTRTEELSESRKEVLRLKSERLIDEKLAGIETDMGKEKFKALAGTVKLEEGKEVEFAEKLNILLANAIVTVPAVKIEESNEEVPETIIPDRMKSYIDKL